MLKITLKLQGLIITTNLKNTRAYLSCLVCSLSSTGSVKEGICEEEKNTKQNNKKINKKGLIIVLQLEFL